MDNRIIKNIIITTAVFIFSVLITIALYPMSASYLYMVLCPVQFLILLCGLVCGWQYGLVCALITPITSFLLIGIPSFRYLPATLIELAILGFAPAILITKAKFIENKYAKLYFSIGVPLVIGRTAAYVFQLFVVEKGEAPSTVTKEFFVAPLIGIALMLTLLPLIYLLLEKHGLISRKVVRENETDYYYYEDEDE